MRNTWSFASAAKIKFGVGAVGELANELQRIGVKRPLVLLGNTAGSLGAVQRALEAMGAAGLSSSVFPGVSGEPGEPVVLRAAEQAREHQADVVVGIGGGSVIDTAKATAVVALCGGRPADYYGEFKVPRALPVVAVPTTAGTGSEVTSVAVIEDDAKKFKAGMSDNKLRPAVALLDPSLTLGLPPAVTAATGMDALGHAVEAYSAVSYKYLPGEGEVIFCGSFELTDMCAERAIALVAGNLRVAVYQGQNVEARANMLLASMLAGLAFGAAGLGPAHAFSYPIAAATGASHGAIISVMLPHVMEFNAPACPQRFARMAELFGENVAGASVQAAAIKAVEAVRKLQEDIGAPARLRDLGLKREDLKTIAEQTIRAERQIRSGPRMPTVQDLLRIAESAY